MTPIYDVSAYAAAVRAALADLDPQVIEELTEGLEADLSEAINDRLGGLPDESASDSPVIAAGSTETLEEDTATVEGAETHSPATDPETDDSRQAVGDEGEDTGAGTPPHDVADALDKAVVDEKAPAASLSRSDLCRLFGDPASYADELRAAAGLGPRGPLPKAPRRHQNPAQWARGWYERLLGPLRARPWWESFAKLAHEVRPIWWVIAAWVIWSLCFARLSYALPRTAVGWLALPMFLVVAVQWGRSQWQPVRALKWAAKALSVVAALLLPLLFANITYRQDVAQQAIDEQYITYDDLSGSCDGSGLAGVTNIYPYDADGNLLEGVRLFDQDGSPIVAGADPSEASFSSADEGADVYGDYDGSPDSIWRLSPAAVQGGETSWNTFPLLGRPVTFDDNGEDVTDQLSLQLPPVPYESVLPLLDDPARDAAIEAYDPKTAVTPAPSLTPTDGASSAPTTSASPEASDSEETASKAPAEEAGATSDG